MTTSTTTKQTTNNSEGTQTMKIQTTTKKVRAYYTLGSNKTRKQITIPAVTVEVREDGRHTTNPQTYKDVKQAIADKHDDPMLVKYPNFVHVRGVYWGGSKGPAQAKTAAPQPEDDSLICDCGSDKDSCDPICHDCKVNDEQTARREAVRAAHKNMGCYLRDNTKHGMSYTEMMDALMTAEAVFLQCAAVQVLINIEAPDSPANKAVADYIGEYLCDCCGKMACNTDNTCHDCKVAAALPKKTAAPQPTAETVEPKVTLRYTEGIDRRGDSVPHFALVEVGTANSAYETYEGTKAEMLLKAQELAAKYGVPVTSEGDAPEPVVETASPAFLMADQFGKFHIVQDDTKTLANCGRDCTRSDWRKSTFPAADLPQFSTEFRCKGCCLTDAVDGSVGPHFVEVEDLLHDILGHCNGCMFFTEEYTCSANRITHNCEFAEARSMNEVTHSVKGIWTTEEPVVVETATPGYVNISEEYGDSVPVSVEDYRTILEDWGYDYTITSDEDGIYVEGEKVAEPVETAKPELKGHVAKMDAVRAALRGNPKSQIALRRDTGLKMSVIGYILEDLGAVELEGLWGLDAEAKVTPTLGQMQREIRDRFEGSGVAAMPIARDITKMIEQRPDATRTLIGTSLLAAYGHGQDQAQINIIDGEFNRAAEIIRNSEYPLADIGPYLKGLGMDKALEDFVTQLVAMGTHRGRKDATRNNKQSLQKLVKDAEEVMAMQERNGDFHGAAASSDRLDGLKTAHNAVK